jgi:hypothetical protein
MKTPTLDKILNDLQDTWGYTPEELADIRMQLLNFAFAAHVDFLVLDEVLYGLELKPIKD